MNYDATIRGLEEKRDYCIAAISVLRKLAVIETSRPEAKPKKTKRYKARKPFSAEAKARMSEAQRVRWAAKHGTDNGNNAELPASNDSGE